MLKIASDFKSHLLAVEIAAIRITAIHPFSNRTILLRFEIVVILRFGHLGLGKTWPPTG